MAGFDLKEEFYEERESYEDELCQRLVVFSSKTWNDSSYKFGFLKAIINNLHNVDVKLKISFNQPISKFSETYCNPTFKFDLRQKAATNDNRKSFIE